MAITLDVDYQAVTPSWPPRLESAINEDGVYELRAVPTTSISLVTNRIVKVGQAYREQNS